MYHSLLQLHRLSRREITRWTRNRVSAAADPQVEALIGPVQMQRVRRPVRHPGQTARSQVRYVPPREEGSGTNE